MISNDKRIVVRKSLLENIQNRCYNKIITSDDHIITYDDRIITSNEKTIDVNNHCRECVVFVVQNHCLYKQGNHVINHCYECEKNTKNIVNQCQENVKSLFT